jgi:hypothetical protein
VGYKELLLNVLAGGKVLETESGDGCTYSECN